MTAMLRLITVILLVAALLTPGGLPAETFPAEQATQRLQETVEILDEARAYLGRANYDSSSLLDFLEFDEQEIIEFINTTIAFRQYRGVLRGTRGTLLARSGNSLDQSLLLAYLLKDVGLEARIVKAKMPPVTAPQVS